MKALLSALIVALLLSAVPVMAQENAPNSSVYTYLDRAADARPPKMAWKATTPEEHAAWRAPFRAKLEELLGEWPETIPQEVRWVEDDVLETDAFTRRKVYIRTEADYWSPAYYFVPKNVTGKRPAVICFHGHSGIYPYIREGTDKQKQKGKDHALDYAPYMAEHGYVTLAVVQRGWNETSSEKDQPHCCRNMSRSSFMIGKTPIAQRVWDGMRWLDFLETREEVDASRIAAAGLSGGGTTTLFFAALEDRVQLAICAGYYCTFRDSIYSIYHCICNCVPEMMLWGEMSDIGALIAPRPMLVISGDKDRIFPIDATQRAYATLAGTYAVLDAEDKIESDFFDGVHQWSNRKTLPFLKQHFGE